MPSRKTASLGPAATSFSRKAQAGLRPLPPSLDSPTAGGHSGLLEPSQPTGAPVEFFPGLNSTCSALLSSGEGSRGRARQS